MCMMYWKVWRYVLVLKLKLIINWSSLNKGNHNGIMREFGYPILISTDFLPFYFSVFSLVFVLIEKIYQKLKKVVHHISNSSEFVKNTPLRVVFSTLFLVFGNVVKHGLSCLIYTSSV